jgi:putative transposase
MVENRRFRPDVELGEFIIMPNHIHGIIGLSGQDSGPNPDSEPSIFTGKSETRGDRTSDSFGEQNTNPIFENTDVCDPGVFDTPLRSPSKTIGSIIRGFKSSVTKPLVSIGIESPIWQRNYYEHIIRNEDSYHRISDYIRNNPVQWQEDEYFNEIS